MSKLIRDFIKSNPNDIINEDDIFNYETENEIFYNNVWRGTVRVYMK